MEGPGRQSWWGWGGVYCPGVKTKMVQLLNYIYIRYKNSQQKKLKPFIFTLGTSLRIKYKWLKYFEIL